MKKPSLHKPGQIRIIAGQWRGRKIKFPAIPGLRPTPDRVRETLFNWLAPIVRGAYCLDLFTGSGALGLEALSRGAAHVVMIDQSPQVIRHLQAFLQTLGVANAQLYLAQVPQGVHPPSHPIDIVFLDPPFHQGLIQSCSHWLEESGWLAPEAMIYLEAERDLNPLPIPPQWRITKSQTAGQVAFYLAQRIRAT